MSKDIEALYKAALENGSPAEIVGPALNIVEEFISALQRIAFALEAANEFNRNHGG